MKNEKKPTYEAPKVITYSEDEITELLGPAQTAGSNTCSGYGPIGG